MSDYIRVKKGALKMAINVLERANKTEIVAALKAGCVEDRTDELEEALEVFSLLMNNTTDSVANEHAEYDTEYEEFFSQNILDILKQAQAVEDAYESNSIKHFETFCDRDN